MENELIGKMFTSKDGYEYKIIDFTIDDFLEYYTILFEDGRKNYLYVKDLITGEVYKYSSAKHIGEIFKSMDNEECRIINLIEHSSNVSRSRFEVEFEDGFRRIFSYSALKNGFRKYPRYSEGFSIIIRDIIKGYHVCKCNLCKSRYIMTYDEIYEHRKGHILDETG